MQIKTITTAVALFVSLAAAMPKEVTVRDTAALTDGEFSELYCCGLGRRGELNTRCCLRSAEEDAVEKRSPVAMPDEEFHELYCCGLGRRGELITRCCL